MLFQQLHDAPCLTAAGNSMWEPLPLPGNHNQHGDGFAAWGSMSPVTSVFWTVPKAGLNCGRRRIRVDGFLRMSTSLRKRMIADRYAAWG